MTPLRRIHERLGVPRLIERPEIRRGDAVAPHELLREGLAAFQPRRRLVRPEDEDARLAGLVRQAAHERRLGADDHEVDLFFADEFRGGGQVVGVQRHAVGQRFDAGVAGHAPERLDARALLEAPGERVLAPAAADEEDVH
jgi:hypothetical protein